MLYSTRYSTRVYSNKMTLYRDIKPDEKHHAKFILNLLIDRGGMHK
jgi:hypothetical protein